MNLFISPRYLLSIKPPLCYPSSYFFLLSTIPNQAQLHIPSTGRNQAFIPSLLQVIKPGLQRMNPELSTYTLSINVNLICTVKPDYTSSVNTVIKIKMCFY